MKLSTLFNKCITMQYIQVENDASYALERIGTTLYIYFQDSNGAEDWKNNLDFPAKSYSRTEKHIWFAHRGFLRVWKTIMGYISSDINNVEFKKIVIVGYSHGAAIAALCHEYVWYNRADIRDRIEGYGFGCPRVFWGFRSTKTNMRWANFTVIRNINDIVTHLPPSALGFSHVGEMLEIGARGKYSAIDAHRANNILSELKAYESKSRPHLS